MSERKDTVDHVAGVSNMVECPECGGAGYHTHPESRCGTCDGSGCVPDASHKTNTMIDGVRMLHQECPDDRRRIANNLDDCTQVAPPEVKPDHVVDASETPRYDDAKVERLIEAADTIACDAAVYIAQALIRHQPETQKDFDELRAALDDMGVEL
ncbi:MAG: hypothetical protein JRI80_00275 [Deltaproteobacteria bacterium]|nr:hypothetical protein [Deltaproteobacteria bacterium]